MTRRIGVCVGLCALIGGLALPCAVAQDAKGEEIVKQVLAAWEKRRKAMKTVRYKIEGTEVYTKGSMTEDSPEAHPKMRSTFPTEDAAFPIRIDYSFDFDQRRMRNATHKHILYVSQGVFVKYHQILLFDGKDGYGVEPHDENPSPSKNQPVVRRYKGRANWFFLSQNNYPLLFAHGIPPLYGVTSDEAQHLSQTYNAESFIFKRVAHVDGRPLAVIQTSPERSPSKYYDEFWLDLSRDSAIVRSVLFYKDRPARVNVVSYQDVSGNWLPSGWTFDRFSPRDGSLRLINSETLRVTHVEIGPRFGSDFFTPTYREGMVVSDVATGKMLSVASDNRSLVPLGHPTRSGHWWWAIIAGGVCILWLSIVYVMRRARKTH